MDDLNIVLKFHSINFRLNSTKEACGLLKLENEMDVYKGEYRPPVSTNSIFIANSHTFYTRN